MNGCHGESSRPPLKSNIGQVESFGDVCYRDPWRIATVAVKPEALLRE
jgi:hypothetical protein